MSKIIDDIVKVCKEIDAQRAADLAKERSTVSTTEQQILNAGISGDPEQDTADDAGQGG